MSLVKDRLVDIFARKVTGVELVMILVKESSRSSHVSPEPSLPRAKALAG